jgi:SpoVK/Ycf46/Vps4 family AAA+-type ATPase
MIEPLQHAEEARKHGLKVGGGILLYGPPGTGKTFIAKAVAGELDLPFYTITAADIFGKYVGESENNIRTLFEEARKNPLSVVFIDELETIFRKRTGDIHETTQKVISVILQELDGVKDGKNPFLLLGATNAPWMIDEAFMRTGRFDVKAYVGLPDLPAREQIIRNAFKHVEYPVDEDAVMYLASATGKCSGADINGIVQSIRQTAFERHADRYTIELFRSCTQHIAPSVNEETLRNIEEWERQNEITRE